MWWKKCVYISSYFPWSCEKIVLLESVAELILALSSLKNRERTHLTSCTLLLSFCIPSSQIYLAPPCMLLPMSWPIISCSISQQVHSICGAVLFPVQHLSSFSLCFGKKQNPFLLASKAAWVGVTSVHECLHVCFESGSMKHLLNHPSVLFSHFHTNTQGSTLII